MLDGNYEVVGKVLFLPIVGKGKCKFSLGKNPNNCYFKCINLKSIQKVLYILYLLLSINKKLSNPNSTIDKLIFENLLFFLDYSNAFANIQMKPVVRSEIEYLDIDKVSWSFTPTNMRIKLDNLFNGDKALGMLLFNRDFITTFISK